jgi:hypothetical protein
MATQTLFVTQGTDFSTSMVLYNDYGTAINVANYTFAGAVRQNPYSNYPSANLKITVVDAANGNSIISLDAANTANMGIGSYIYSVVANTGTNTALLLSGDFIVGPSALVTQPLPANVTNQVLDDTFYALSGQNSFYLSYTPANTSNVTIIYNNVMLPNNVNVYTITGQVLIFANSAAQGDVIQANENVSVVVL